MILFSILLFFVQYSIALPIRFSPSTALEIKLIQLQIWLEKTWFEKNSKLREWKSNNGSHSIVTNLGSFTSSSVETDRLSLLNCNFIFNEKLNFHLKFLIVFTHRSKFNSGFISRFKHHKEFILRKNKGNSQELYNHIISCLFVINRNVEIC